MTVQLEILGGGMLRFSVSRLTTASGCMLWVLGALLGTQSPLRAQNIQASQPAVATEVEEIYIARSVRESRIPPTEFCAKARTGVGDAISEDQHTFRSVATRTSDGRVIDANVKTIGSIHSCNGRTANPAVFDFYGDIDFRGTAFKGLGECRFTKTDFPEKGLTAYRCFLDLSDLPGEYVGGQLTTNTMFSRKILGMESDPGGYTQSSIATVRLWKKRMRAERAGARAARPPSPECYFVTDR
jgi:hypothetical protein